MKLSTILLAFTILFAPTLLWGHDEIQLKYAKRFTVEYKGNSKIIKLNSAWKNSKKIFTYVLVKRGEVPNVKIPDGAVVVEIPVKTAVLTSTTAISHFVDLAIQDKIKAVLKIKDVNSEEIIKLYKEGAIIEVGSGFSMNQGVSIEKMYKLRPEIIFTYAVGLSKYDVHPKLKEAGFKFVLSAAYMEETPLGRSEWVKFISLFFNKEKEATMIFSKTEEKYLALIAKVKKITIRPTVLSNISFQGDWFLPQGESFIAKYIQDAGGDYLWKKTKGISSIQTPIERVIIKARDADFWLNTGSCRSKNEMLKIDPRFRIIKAFKINNVFNNNLRMNQYGGNDFYESGSANPDQVLADLIKILHPELLPNHKSIFYKQLK